MRRDLAFIAALALAISAVAQTGGKTPNRFVISDFGAVADGKTVNTRPIQAAIDKCAASGGGMVVVPKGTFLTGAIFLKLGANLNSSSLTSNSSELLTRRRNPCQPSPLTLSAAGGQPLPTARAANSHISDSRLFTRKVRNSVGEQIGGYDLPERSHLTASGERL